MTPEQEIFLVKTQAGIGVPETSLVADDLLEATGDSKLEVVPAFEEVDTVSGLFGNEPSVLGLVNATAGLSAFVRSKGNASGGLKPDIDPLAKATGMIESEILCTGDKSKYKYSPALESCLVKDITAWHYSGGCGIGQSILRKFGNIQGNWKISAKTGGKAKFELTDGKGIYLGESASTRPTVASSILHKVYPATIPLVILIDGVAYNVLDFSFEGGNTVDQYIKVTEQYGYGASEITKKKGKFDFTCYSEIGKQFPMAKVLDGALEGAMALTWGPTGEKIEIVAAYPQYKDCKFESSGNLSVWKVSGELTRNDFSITFNSDLTPV